MRTTALALAGLLGSTVAWADCEHERVIDKTLDVASADQLRIVAGAGDLEIRGEAGRDDVRVIGTICASKEEWAAESDVDTQEGRNALVAVVMPDVDWNMSWTGKRYVYIDLDVRVPQSLALDIMDSSGDIEIDGTGSLTLKDSSGDIEIEDVAGVISLEDSSGDIDIIDLDGDLVVEHDSSGDLYGRGVTGSVLVKKDSSGDIRFKEVDQDVIVERDSSGSIIADAVGGDFRVLKDGSGDIRHSNVAGEVQLPDKG